MSRSENDRETENLKRSARLFYKNTLIRMFIMYSPLILGVGIMFFFRTKIGLSLGVFTSGFVGVFGIIIYYYDKHMQNIIYYKPYEKGRLISHLVLTVFLWSFALRTFLR